MLDALTRENVVFVYVVPIKSQLFINNLLMKSDSRMFCDYYP